MLTSLQTSGEKSVITVVRTLAGRFSGPTALAELAASFLFAMGTARSAAKGAGKRSCEDVSGALGFVFDRLTSVLRGLVSSWDEAPSSESSDDVGDDVSSLFLKLALPLLFLNLIVDSMMLARMSCRWFSVARGAEIFQRCRLSNGFAKSQSRGSMPMRVHFFPPQTKLEHRPATHPDPPKFPPFCLLLLRNEALRLQRGVCRSFMVSGVWGRLPLDFWDSANVSRRVPYVT